MGLYWLMLQFLYKAKFVVLVYYGDFCVIVINGWMQKKYSWKLFSIKHY